MKSLLTVCVLLVVAATPGSSIRCHVCDSVNTPGCQDPFSTVGVANRECLGVGNTRSVAQSVESIFPGITEVRQAVSSENFGSSCMKVVTTVQGRTATVRGCTFVSCSVLRQATEGVGGVQNFCAECKGDLCNASPRSVEAALFSFLLAPLAMLLKTL